MQRNEFLITCANIFVENFTRNLRAMGAGHCTKVTTKEGNQAIEMNNNTIDKFYWLRSKMGRKLDLLTYENNKSKEGKALNKEDWIIAGLDFSEDKRP